MSFSGAAGDDYIQRYARISRVLRRFDYPQRNKRYRAPSVRPSVPFARKYTPADVGLL